MGSSGTKVERPGRRATFVGENRFLGMRLFRGFACAVLLVWVVVISIAGSAVASPDVAGDVTGTPKPVVFRPRWHQIATQVTGLQASREYLLLCLDNHAVGCTTPTLINDLTGARTLVHPPCGSPLLGVPWLLANCGSATQPDIWLGPLAGGAWRENPGAASTFMPCDPQTSNCGQIEPIGIGTDWIEWDVSPCYHCAPPPSPVFTSIQTGAQRVDPTNATTVADLNSPSLARKVCSPLLVPRTPSGTDYGGPGGSSLPSTEPLP